MITNKLNLNANKVDRFIKKFLKKQDKTPLISPMKYGVLSGGKKIRSSIILAAGKVIQY